jgi:hypothetical protein
LPAELSAAVKTAPKFVFGTSVRLIVRVVMPGPLIVYAALRS